MAHRHWKYILVATGAAMLSAVICIISYQGAKTFSAPTAQAFIESRLGEHSVQHVIVLTELTDEYLLHKRCIDREILNAFMRKKLIYESCERSRDGTREYHNAVFVGFDELGVPRHGHKRGLYTMGQSYRGNIEGSDPKHSFHYLGGDDTLYVFEAPIDLLSYISLFPEGWQEHNYVACCGTSSIPVLEMLRQLPQLQQVYLCLDNDAAGHAASERMAKLLEERGISAERLVPQQKDWNDDLKAEQENKMERSELCQTFC